MIQNSPFYNKVATSGKDDCDWLYNLPHPFHHGMKILITAAGKEAQGPKLELDMQQPPIRGNMDDLTVITTTHAEATWVLTVLDQMAE